MDSDATDFRTVRSTSAKGHRLGFGDQVPQYCSLVDVHESLESPRGILRKRTLEDLGGGLYMQFQWPNIVPVREGFEARHIPGRKSPPTAVDMLPEVGRRGRADE